ncbi:MAG: mannose-1-phosphate guanylyltransferase [Clostridia bacterium]|nr:mannose-1-phosphate guanylyltransferase [Clostridia bacterium]
MSDIRYIELKTGYSDDGPAWIGRVKVSKSGKTVYFNDHAFQKWNGVRGNYVDIETDEEYWISSVKKNGCDRHWAGRGRIMIDRKVLDEYLEIVGWRELPASAYTVTDIPDRFPVERINRLMNEKDAEE